MQTHKSRFACCFACCFACLALPTPEEENVAVEVNSQFDVVCWLAVLAVLVACGVGVGFRCVCRGLRRCGCTEERSRVVVVVAAVLKGWENDKILDPAGKRKKKKGA
eukprot:m.86629 g.86629  ORF g.86629 m.86629 type:complete len:107 (-) comp17976_c1_seq1:212-532(-)